MIQAFRKVVDLHDNDGDDVREEKEVERDAFRQEQIKIQQTTTDCLWRRGLCHSLGQFEELDKVVRVNGQSHVHSKPNLRRMSDLV